MLLLEVSPKVLSFYQRTGKIYYISFGFLTSLSFTAGRPEYMSLLHRKEICVVRLRSQISSKSYKHTRVLISSNLKITVVNRLPIFLVLATPPKLRAKKSMWSVTPLIMQYLYFSWPLKRSLWVLESMATSRFQTQRTNGSQKGAILLNVWRLSSRTPYFKLC